MENAIFYIYDNVFEPLISAIITGISNLAANLSQNENLFTQPLTITLFSDTPIVVTTLYDITIIILSVLFSFLFAKFILYLLKVPFNFFRKVGQ